MTTDLIERLRALSRSENSDLSVGGEAADEIERLRDGCYDNPPYHLALAALKHLLDANPKAGSAEAALLLSLTDGIQAYEKIKFPELSESHTPGEPSNG